MKRNLSKNKISRLLVCTLLIASVFQITAISMVQATSENIQRPTAILPSPDEAVIITNDDPVLITGLEEPVLISTEDGELISTNPETSTITEEQEIEKVKPADDATIGTLEDGNQEDYQPLIAPNPQSENTQSTLGPAVLLVAVAMIAALYIALGHKKTS